MGTIGSTMDAIGVTMLPNHLSLDGQARKALRWLASTRSG
jgi:hypothetical protein